MAQIVVPVPTWKQVKPWIWRCLGLALVVFVAYVVREIWLPLAIAFLIALVLDPVVDKLEHRGISRGIGAAIIFGGFLVALAGVLVVSIPAIVDQGTDIQKRVDKFMPDRSAAGIDKTLTREHVSPALRSVIKEVMINVEGSVSKSSSAITQKALDFASNLIWVVIIPIVAFYALRDFHLILGKALLLIRKEKRDLFQVAIVEVTAIFAKYLRGLLIVSVLNGLATWGVLAAFQVPSAFILGMMAGVLYSVPYIGALLTVAITSLISLLAGGVNFMLTILAVNILLHQVVFDQIITPRIVGGNVGLHPIIAIVALLSGNALLGLAGMILAVPVAACLQIGVLAMMPKLKQEIQLSPMDQAKVDVLADETLDQQTQVDATAELHKTVIDAVEHIEAEMPKA